MVRFEAESLTLDNYAPEEAGFATLIAISNLAAIGSTTIENFGEASGTYTIDIAYIDENDGSSALELFVDGASVGTRTLDDNIGTAAADEGNLRTWTLTGIEINNDSEIRLQGSPNSAERVRIDYLEFTVESTGDDELGSGETPSTEIVVQAESDAFTLVEGYQVEGDVIVLGDAANSGTAFTDFSGADGTYDVIVGYLDESDGEATLAVSVGDSSLGSFTFSDASGGPSAETAARLEQTFAGVELSQGDRITLTGTRAGNEFARIDYVKFVRNELDDPNQAPVPENDSGATATNTPLEINVLANDADPDSDPLTVSDVDATTAQNGTVEILENGTLRYSPATDFEGQDSFTYTVSDGELTDTATVTIEVTDDDDLPVPPVADDDFGTTPQDTDLVINVLDGDIDPDGDDESLTVTSVDTTTAQGGTAEIQSDGTVLYRPPSGFAGQDSFAYTMSDVDGLTDTATVSVEVAPPDEQDFKKVGDNLFVLEGTGATAKFSLENPSSTPGAFEFGFYATDNIGLPPGSAGYTTAALSQSTTVFSLLGDGDVQLPSLHRILSLAENTNYSFFLVENGTVDSVLKGGAGKVTLGSLLDANAGGPLQYEYVSGTDSYRLNWDTDRNGTLDFSVDLSFPEDLGVPLGARLQGGSESELLDLRGLQEVQLSVQVRREASFNNQVGFYRIENEQGAIRVGNDLLYPGDSGYVEAALRQWANNPALQTSNGETRNYELTLGGGLWAPFIVVDGTIERYLDNLRGNDPAAVYFSFIAANPDGADHVRLLGDNVFGFEDSAGGGDGDFDDVIISMTPRINPGTDLPSPISSPTSTLTVADDTFSMTSDQPLTFSIEQLLSNDGDSAGNPIALQDFTVPANGSLSPNQDGTFTYVSNPGFGGRDSFRYTVNNGSGETATATVNIDVTFINNDPVGNDDTAVTDENSPLTILGADLLTNDTDVDNQSLSLESIAQPSNGSLVPDNNGAYLYTPNPNFFGTDTFTYVVSDSNGGNDTATVTITVNSTNSTPSAVDDTFATEFETAITFSPASLLANDTDPDNDTLAIIELDDPSNGSLILNGDGSYTYTPDDNFLGEDSFTYTVADGEGETSTATAEITVLRRNSGNTANYSDADQGVILNLATDVALQPEFGALATPRLMPLGDSITNGGHSVGPTPGAYRIQFWDRAIADGLTVDFIGGLSNGPDRLGDQDHAGYRGDTIGEIEFRVNNDTVNVEATDAILLMIGTNDVGDEEIANLTSPGAINTRAEVIRDRLSDLIDTITAEAPNAYLYVSSIPPRDTPVDDVKIELTEAFNDLIPDLVAAKEGEGKRVIFVEAGGRLTAGDMNGVNSDTDNRNEGVHPTSAGYENLGNFWYDEVFEPESLDGRVNLIGSDFDDRLFGDGANNILAGGEGEDSLTGGEGVDAFWYRDPNEGQDSILDFGSNDRIWISASGFGNGLAAGTALDSDAFVSGTNPVAGENKATFLFNTSDNTLRFDPDGTGSSGATALAIFTNGYQLQFNQIDIVA